MARARSPSSWQRVRNKGHPQGWKGWKAGGPGARPGMRREHQGNLSQTFIAFTQESQLEESPFQIRAENPLVASEMNPPSRVPQLFTNTRERIGSESDFCCTCSAQPLTKACR